MRPYGRLSALHIAPLDSRPEFTPLTLGNHPSVKFEQIYTYRRRVNWDVLEGCQKLFMIRWMSL